MRVRWRLTKARHAAISFEVIEWSEQLRSVTSIWLGAVRRSVQVRLCTSGCKSEKLFGIISPPRDLFSSNNNNNDNNNKHYEKGHYATRFNRT